MLSGSCSAFNVNKHFSEAVLVQVKQDLNWGFKCSVGLASITSIELHFSGEQVGDCAVCEYFSPTYGSCIRGDYC